MSVAIYIEADEGNTLGGSCIRDLYNIANAVPLDFVQSHVFTHATLLETIKKRFPSGSYFHTHSRDPLRAFSEIVDQLVGSGILFVVISGHGYQIRDVSGDEIDGYDEHIRIRGIPILDDALRECFIDNLPTTMSFVGVTDTCHSGTMFDLDYSWNGRNWTRARKCAIKRLKDEENITAVSIAACRDSQLENCDVGETVGFGGALCVHLIESKMLGHLLACDKSNAIRVYDCLMKIFRLLRQEPVIQINQ